MKPLNRSLRYRCGSAIIAVLLTGCGTTNRQTSIAVIPETGFSGSIHGGQQVISGSSIQLYAVGTTGDGSAATPLLSQTVTSNASGGFNITGMYTCPSPLTPVYIVGTGGNPGLAPGSNNPNLALMTALGPCGNLAPSTFIVINEVTTVGAIYALVPFMTSVSAIGSSSTDTQALASAFTLASQLVNSSTGSAPGTNLPTGYTVPVATINSLADLLAICINSGGGTAGDGTTCGNLFSLSTPTTAPATPPATNTIAALLSIANNPSLNTVPLFNLIPSISPFQPQLVLPPDSFSPQSILPTNLTVAPLSLQFPDTVTGFQSSQTLTLTNTGTTPVVFTESIYVSARDFSYTNSCPLSLDPGASCSLQVNFAPGQNGSQSAGLVIYDNAANSRRVISLAGAGVTGSTAGPITVSPASLEFSTVGTPQTVTLTNLGTTPLQIGTISTTPGIGYGYSQTNNCGSTLQAQSICTIDVFANGLSTNITGSLTVWDDAASGPQVVSLHTANQAALPNNSLSFGPWAVGTTSATLLLAASRTAASQPVTLIVGSVSGPNASDFLAAQGYSCTSGTACTFPVSFKPSGQGTRTATLPTSLGNIFLSGIGIASGPNFTFSVPNSPSFAMGQILNTSSVLTATLTNNGTTTLELSGAVTGTNTSDFTLASQCTAPLAPGLSCTIGITFTPKQLGPFVNLFTMTDSVSGTSQTYSFVSNGVQPPPAITPSPFDFGNVALGASSAPKTFDITGPVGDPLSVTILNGNTGPFVVTQISGCGSPPCTATVVFTPSLTNCCYSYLAVTDTVTGSLNYVALSGTAGVPVVSPSPSSLSFPIRSVGSTSIAQTITLTNTGDAVLQIGGVSLSGSSPSDFVLSSSCGSSLSPNAQCTLSVSFAPTASGIRNANIQIVSNAASSPDLIQLSGTAQ